MKNNIKKINTIGKVSSIILILSEILLIVSFVVLIASGIGMLFVPDDFISASVDASAEIYIDSSELPFMFADAIEDITDDVQEVDFDYGKFYFNIEDEGTTKDELAVKLNGSVEQVDGRAIAAAIAASLVFSAVFVAIVFVMMIFAYKLAKALANCNSPFEENVVKRMKHFGFSMIPWAVLSCFDGSFSNGAYGANIGININLTSLLIVAVILVLIYIFDFGAQLQRESDETL